MRSGLATRIDRLSARVERRTMTVAAIICAEYDRDDSDVIGLQLGDTALARQAGETVEQLLQRAVTQTGIPMWAAAYGYE